GLGAADLRVLRITGTMPGPPNCGPAIRSVIRLGPDARVTDRLPAPRREAAGSVAGAYHRPPAGLDAPVRLAGVTLDRATLLLCPSHLLRHSAGGSRRSPSWRPRTVSWGMDPCWRIDFPENFRLRSRLGRSAAGLDSDCSPGLTSISRPGPAG